MKVSVVVAVHNEDRYIGRCLRSLIRQNFDHDKFEIIVVDDGSDDKTPYALELFAGDIRVVTHPENMGLPSAVNSGLEACAGEYVVRVDSDDYVNEHFLTILCTYLDFNEECAAVGCDYLLIDESETVLGRKSSIDEPIACGIMFRHKMLRSVGKMNEKFLLNEEKEFRKRFEKKYVIENIPIPLYRYRRHDGNMTNDKEALEKYNALLELT